MASSSRYSRYAALTKTSGGVGVLVTHVGPAMLVADRDQAAEPHVASPVHDPQAVSSPAVMEIRFPGAVAVRRVAGRGELAPVEIQLELRGLGRGLFGVRSSNRKRQWAFAPDLEEFETVARLLDARDVSSWNPPQCQVRRRSLLEPLQTIV